MMIKISASSNGEGKIYTYDFQEESVNTLEELGKLANRKSISSPLYEDGHRKQSNILVGGSIILMDCDAPGQAEAVESRIQHYDYIKVPSASNSEATPYKWHFFVLTQTPLSVYPAAMKSQVEQFFQQVGITDDMIDTTGSYDIARQFAPASIKLDPDEADDLSTVNETDLQVPIVDAPEELCNSAAKSVAVNINGVTVSELPSGHLWYKGKAITYTDAITAVEEACKTKESDIVSGFGCPHDNHRHTADRTRGYGFAYKADDGSVVIKCTGNECKGKPYFVVPDFIELADASEHSGGPLLDTPIPIDFYVKTMKEHWIKTLGQIVADGMEYNWSMFADTMNRIVKENLAGGTSTAHIIGMATGESKTQGSIVYTAILNKYTDHKAMIVVNLNEDAFLVADQINDLGGDAIAYNSDVKNKGLTPDKASTHQTVIISHETFKRHGHIGSKKWETLSKDRDLIIVDEALHDVEVSVVDEFSLDKLRPVAQVLKDKQMLEMVNGFRNVIRNDIPREPDSGHIQVVPLKETAIPLRLFAEVLGEGRASTMADPMKQTKHVIASSVAIISDFIKRIDKLPKENPIICKARGIRQITHEYIYREETKREAKKLMTIWLSGVFATKAQGSLTAVKELLPGSISFAVMDATSSVNAIYQLQHTYRKNIRIVPVKKTRNYKKFKINTIEVVTGARSLSGEDIHKLLDSIPLVNNDKIFVVTHKKLEPFVTSWIENQSAPKITFDVEHFGNLTGKNTWRDFNKVVVIGLPHKNSQLYQALNIIKTDELTAYSEYGKRNLTLIENTDLSADLVQAMARICIRNVNDKDGGCLPAEAYITINPKPSMKKIIMDALHSQFSGATFSEWVVDDMKKKQAKLPKGFESTLSYLDTRLTEVTDELPLYEPRDALGIKRDTYSRLFKDKAFKDRLQDMSIVIQERPAYNHRRGVRKKRPEKIFFKMK